MAQRDVLKKSDCDLPEANVFPGKWHRRNKTGSVEFDKKSQWVANECKKWYDYMKDNPLYDNTPIWQKVFCLSYHLRKLKVANSEVRKLLIQFEECCNSESDTEETMERDNREQEKTANTLMDDRESQKNIDSDDKNEEKAGESDSDSQDIFMTTECNTDVQDNEEDADEESMDTTHNVADSQKDMFADSDEEVDDRDDTTERMDEDVLREEINIDTDTEDDDIREMSRVEKEAQLERFLKRPITELLAEESSLPSLVTKSKRFKEIKSKYINSYVEEELDGLSSQDIFKVYTQIPDYITESDCFKRKMDHLPDKEKSEKRILKNINETLCLLKDAGTREAMEQRKIITGAVYDHRFGYPELSETRTVKKESKELKRNLLTGEKSDLQPEKRVSCDYFPISVQDIAEKCWRRDCTVIEPGKHTRPKAAIQDGSEKIPAIYQTLTDREAYTVFEEMYKEEVKDAMKDDCNKSREKLERSSASQLKQKKLDLIEKKENRFPSQTWFLKQKPKETKARSDHCTGLCGDCEGPQLNYDTLRKRKQKMCKCKTKMCPMWFCTCDLDEEGEVRAECTCDPCFCDECMKCKVCNSLSHIFKSQSVSQSVIEWACFCGVISNTTLRCNLIMICK